MRTRIASAKNVPSRQIVTPTDRETDQIPAKAANLELEMVDPPLPEEIPKAACVAAVNATRAAPAQGTGRCGGASTDPYDHAIRVDDDLLNRKAGWEQGQQRIGHGEDSTL
jgi:hypothetical protein